ncbi:hypothetical protein EBME_1259 [bacterium endosymbiont of Mortierella elongata FMR23-6]|nr:hypothetical protein EBME_1259 [bacterium endosymbiont of Mortierella elongata FMR23-6]
MFNVFKRIKVGWANPALFFLKFDDFSDLNIFFAVFAKITPQVYKFYTKRRIYYLIASFFYREFLIFDWVRAK